MSKAPEGRHNPTCAAPTELADFVGSFDYKEVAPNGAAVAASQPIPLNSMAVAQRAGYSSAQKKRTA